MNCCDKCFSDSILKRNFEDPSSATTEFKCNFCNNTSTSGINPENLRDPFEILIESAYEKDENGRLISELLKDDWEIFSPSLAPASMQQLLVAIFDDDTLVRKTKFKKRALSIPSLTDWDTLRRELKHQNRFFLTTSLDEGWLWTLFDCLVEKSSSADNWYRARIQQSENAYALNEMGAPPHILASHGRANPAGIPYLYLASDSETAISEVRPHIGENVSMAEFNLIDDLRFVNLINPKKSISPFQPALQEAVCRLRKDVLLLEEFSKELSLPVTPSSASFNYVPSQFLCEFIKKCNFDGVIYKSSIGSGRNLALFKINNATAKSVKSHRINGINFSCVEL